MIYPINDVDEEKEKIEWEQVEKRLGYVDKDGPTGIVSLDVREECSSYFHSEQASQKDQVNLPCIWMCNPFS